MPKRKRINRPKDARADQVPTQPDTHEQSGSTGRRIDKNDTGHEKDSGQDHYGQSGFSGAEPTKNTH